MPKKRINKKQMVKKNGKVLNTKWINNAMRSVGSISTTVFKDMAPTLYETGKEIGSSINNVRKTIKGTNMKEVSNQLSGNKYISLGKKMIDNALEDLKSGNLDNQKRVDDSMMNDMFGDETVSLTNTTTEAEAEENGHYPVCQICQLYRRNGLRYSARPDGLDYHGFHDLYCD